MMSVGRVSYFHKYLIVIVLSFPHFRRTHLKRLLLCRNIIYFSVPCAVKITHECINAPARRACAVRFIIQTNIGTGLSLIHI